MSQMCIFFFKYRGSRFNVINIVNVEDIFIVFLSCIIYNNEDKRLVEEKLSYLLTNLLDFENCLEIVSGSFMVIDSLQSPSYAYGVPL